MSQCRAIPLGGSQSLVGGVPAPRCCTQSLLGEGGGWMRGGGSSADTTPGGGVCAGGSRCPPHPPKNTKKEEKKKCHHISSSRLQPGPRFGVADVGRRPRPPTPQKESWGGGLGGKGDERKRGGSLRAAAGRPRGLGWLGKPRRCRPGVGRGRRGRRGVGAGKPRPRSGRRARWAPGRGCKRGGRVGAGEPGNRPRGWPGSAPPSPPRGAGRSSPSHARDIGAAGVGLPFDPKVDGNL